MLQDNTIPEPMFDLKPYTLSPEETGVRAKLIDKFLIPPFSILDTRQGYWQNRKRLWLSLGIKSELGRSDNLTYTKGRPENNVGKNIDLYRDKELEQEKGFYDSIIEERGGGTSIFDPVLCELIYRWFSPEKGTVLDPFAGGSVRGIVATILGRNYTGIDLNKSQIEENRKQAEKITPNNSPIWFNGNSENINTILPENTYYDLVFSCPPYHDLEKYSDDWDDLSNMSWRAFKEKYLDIIKKCIIRLKSNRFACFVVSEIRDKDGYYKGLVPYTIQCFELAGTKFYNDIILVNNVGSLPVRITQQFNNGRKIGRVHQNILIFYKGEIQKMQNTFKELNFAESDTVS